jgi:nicotinate-nucleotide adenylyltransferase
VRTIRGELEKFSPDLAKKTWILTLSKIDTIDDDERQLLLDEACEAFPEREIIPFSSATRENIDLLNQRMIRMLEEHLESQWTRIGLFGGTFDPVHKGHLEVAKMALERFDLDRVIFMPANIPPHKIGREIGRPVHRLAMLNLATAEEPAFEVSEYEIKRGGRSYTIDTIRHLLEQDPQREIFLIVGFDNAADIMSWREIEEFPRLCRIVAVHRDGFDWDEIKVRLSRDVYNRVEVVKDFSFPAQAENIRGGMGDEGKLREILPREILEYIRENGLYQ